MGRANQAVETRPSCVLVVAAAGDGPVRRGPTAATGWLAHGAFFVLCGQRAATAASLLTGVSARVHGVDRHHSALAYPGPNLAGLLRAEGYHTVALSDDPAVSRARGFARGFDAFVETGPAGEEVPPIATLDRWLDGRRDSQRPFFALLWQPHEAVDALLAHLSGAAALEQSVIVTIAVRRLERDDGASWPAFVPTELSLRPPCDDPQLQLTAGPAGPAHILPTVLALLALEPPAGLPVQGRSLVCGAAHGQTDSHPPLIDHIGDDALGLDWTVGIDAAWAYLRLTEQRRQRVRALSPVWWRRLRARLTQPRLRRPLAALRRDGSFESRHRLDLPATTGADPADSLPRAFARAVSSWQAECAAVRAAAARWGDGDEEQTLRHRLRGLGYLG